jgi:hypothetical protein
LLTPAAAASMLLLLPTTAAAGGSRIDASSLQTAGSASASASGAGGLLDKTFVAAGLVPQAQLTLKCTTGGASLHRLTNPARIFFLVTVTVLPQLQFFHI